MDERTIEEQERLAWIMPTLRGNGVLWHRTSLASLMSILDHGAIEPNDGRFPETYPQSRVSYGKMIGAVCLFDFDSEPLDDIYEHAWKWSSFLHDQDLATVLIGIDRILLDPGKVLPPGTVTIVSNNDRAECIEPDGTIRWAEHEGRQLIPMYIPSVEAWHKGPISTTQFREYILIRRGAHDEFVRVRIGPDALTEILRLAAQWADLAPASWLEAAVRDSLRSGSA